MPDASLHGNGTRCPACELRRESMFGTGPFACPCNECKGTGRIARSTKDIIADHVAWARENYWLQSEKRKTDA